MEWSLPVADPRPPESRFSITTGGKSAFPAPGRLGTLTWAMPSPPLCPFPAPEISVLSSLSYPSERVDVRQLQHHFSQLVRPTPSGQGLTWWVVSRSGEALPMGVLSHKWQMFKPQQARSSKSNHPQYAHLCFPAAKRRPLGYRPTQQISIHLCTHAWESQRWQTPSWFPGLMSPVGSGQGAPSFTGPSWRRTGWCLNRHQAGGRLK